MIDVDKVISIIKYCGPQTYEDFRLQGFAGRREELDELVVKGILSKSDNIYKIAKK